MTDESPQLKHYRAICEAGKRYADSCNGKLGKLTIYYARQIIMAEQALSDDDRYILHKGQWINFLWQRSRDPDEQDTMGTCTFGIDH